MPNPAFNDSFFKRRLRKGIGLRILILKALETNYLENNAITAYELQNKIYQMTHSLWKPSPGSIYPILEELTEKDFVVVENRDNKDYYALNKKGKEIFNQILGYKLLADIIMHTQIYDSFDPVLVQIPIESTQFRQNIQEIGSMIGMFVEKEGIHLENMREHIIGIEKEIQKEKIQEIIKGIDKYIQILEGYQEKFIVELNKINSDENIKK